MEPHSWSSSGMGGLLDGVLTNSRFEAKTRNGSSSTSSLVLDSQRGELVEANASLERKGVSAERSSVALKNHCEAERKRRSRINAHLDTLRSIVPGAKKMDKASLLAEVISHMKELKRCAAEACEGLFLPTDVDEVRVEEQEDGLDGHAPYLIRVSLCCDYKPGLLSDLRQALDALHLIVMKAEIATLEGRMKNKFVITSYKERSEDTEAHQLLASSVNQAIRSILDKFSATQEFSLKSTLSHKRRRISLFDPSFSSSPSGDLW